MAGVKYELHCPSGFTYSGYQACILWMVKDQVEEAPGAAVNISHEIAALWNARASVLGQEESSVELAIVGKHPIDGDCFLVMSGESFTLEDVASILEDTLLVNEQVGNSISSIECFDGGEETTIKVGVEPYTCDCGETVFRKCSPGKYKCKCGRFLYNKPPGGIQGALDSIPEVK